LKVLGKVALILFSVLVSAVLFAWEPWVPIVGVTVVVVLLAGLAGAITATIIRIRAPDASG